MSTSQRMFRPQRLLFAVLNLLAAATPSAAQGPATAVPAAAPQEYTILIFETPSDLQRRNAGASASGYWGAYNAFAQALAQAGALRGGTALSESTTITVRGEGSADRGVRGARLGGYFIISASTPEEARRLAGLAPAFAVAVELRPHRDNPTMAPGTP